MQSAVHRIIMFSGLQTADCTPTLSTQQPLTGHIGACDLVSPVALFMSSAYDVVHVIA